MHLTEFVCPANRSYIQLIFDSMRMPCFGKSSSVVSMLLSPYTANHYKFGPTFDAEFEFELDNSNTGSPRIQFMLSWLLASFGHFMQDKSRLAFSRKDCRCWLGELFSQSSTMLQSIWYLRVNGKQKNVRLFDNAMICFKAVRILIASTKILFGNCGPQFRIRDLLFRTPEALKELKMRPTLLHRLL